MGDLLNVSDLQSLAPESYVEPGFVATVHSVVPRRGKAPMRAQLLDVNNGDHITAALWNSPRIAAGDLVEFSGRGIKMKEFHDKLEVSIMKETDVRVVGGGLPRNSVPGTGGRPPTPSEEARAHRPDPAAQTEFNTDGDPLTVAANNVKRFHQGMNRQAVLLCWSYIYSRRILLRLQADMGFQFDPSEEESRIRTIATTLVIEANKQGLAGLVVNLDSPDPGAQRASAPRHPTAASVVEPKTNIPKYTPAPERFQAPPGDDIQV